MDQQLGKDQVAEILAVRVSPVLFIQQGIEQVQDDMISLFIRNNQVLILQVGAHGAQGFRQENGQGGDKLGIEPEHDPLDVPGRPLQFRPVRFPRRNQDQVAGVKIILTAFHMVSIAVGKQAVKLVKIMPVRRHAKGCGIAVVVYLDVVPAHLLQHVEGGYIGPVHSSHFFQQYFYLHYT